MMRVRSTWKPNSRVWKVSPECPTSSRVSPVALDAASGATIWNDQPLVVEGAPTLAGDRLVYPGVAGGGPGAIDVRDGAVLWNVEGIDFRVGGPVFVTSSGTFRPPWAPSASR